MKTLEDGFSVFVKLLSEDIKNMLFFSPCRGSANLPYLTSLTPGLVQQVKTQQYPVLAKDQHTLWETYVHLTPLSDVRHFSSVTVMTDPLWGFGVARSNMEKM